MLLFCVLQQMATSPSSPRSNSKAPPPSSSSSSSCSEHDHTPGSPNGKAAAGMNAVLATSQSPDNRHPAPRAGTEGEDEKTGSGETQLQENYT